jgi:hypothetical protein
MMEKQHIVSLNVPLAGALMNPTARDLIHILLSNYSKPEALFINRTIRETIFGWKDDPLLTALSKLLPALGIPTTYPGLQSNDTSQEDALNTHSFNIEYTGKWTRNLMRELVEWDGLDELFCCPYGVCGDAGTGSETQSVAPWKTDEAESIRGSFDGQFHPSIDLGEILYLSTYNAGVYRHWPIEYDHNGPYKVKGIDLFRYQLPTKVLGNWSVDPLEALSFGINGYSGLLNMSACEWGAQVVISRPHFLYGSNPLWQAIGGLSPPDPSLHDSWLGIEQHTGQTLDLSFKVGINLFVSQVKSSSGFVYFGNVSSNYVPMAYVDHHATVSDSDAEDLKTRVVTVVEYMNVSQYLGIAGAALGGLAFCLFMYWGIRRRERRIQLREVAIQEMMHTYYQPFVVEALTSQNEQKQND